MNSKKIGEFIARVRKSKGMTQQELAEKLHVTDRAISNYENGRRIPDVSLFKPLCEILDISVNELINGEKIELDKVLSTSDNTIINTLNINKNNNRKAKHVIITLFIVLFCLLTLIIIKYKQTYPKFDIYSILVASSDPYKEYELKKQLNYKNRNIYYYGIDFAQLCDTKDKCYFLDNALNYKQIDIDKIKNYLESQFILSNVKRYILYDGGTMIYLGSGYTVLFCNTNEGNKDIYFGNDEMLDNLNGNYCGHETSTLKSFIRTYHIISVIEDIEDNEFNYVTLKQYGMEKETVKINNSYNVVPGKNYEFSFYIFDRFDDNTKNIFEYGTIVNVKETDKKDNNQINEDIFINAELKNKDEMNELKNVYMEIKEGTLTEEGVTIIITDYSGNKYSYGTWFKIEKYENGNWIELNFIHDNIAFNSIAYGTDINGKLELTHDWSYMYGKLPSGKYRLVKDALPNLDRPVIEDDRKYFSVIFDL